MAERRFGEVRRALEQERVGWELSSDVDDDAEVPQVPLLGEDEKPPLAGESGLPVAEVDEAALRAARTDPHLLAAAVERGEMTRAAATRRLRAVWGDEVELDDFTGPR